MNNRTFKVKFVLNILIMKRITAKLTVSVLIMALVIGTSLLSVEGKELDNCATAISQLNWSDSVDPANASNTLFKFDATFEFFNPNPKDVTLNFPNQRR